MIGLMILRNLVFKGLDDYILNQFNLSPSINNMCIFNSRISTADEDFPAIKKKKSRNPKPRDKWSLLWFIPSQTLNKREDITDSRGAVARRGKRIDFDSFNSRSCKLCHISFHKKLIRTTIIKDNNE